VTTLRESPVADPFPLLPEAVLPVRAPYHLRRTLTCGQAFGWVLQGRGISGVFAGRQVYLEQTSQGIRVSGLDAAGDLQALQRYLALDAPLQAIEGRLRADPVLRRILPHTSGIALLRQDPWECLLSFVISAYNNIPKVTLSLRRLRDATGAELEGGRVPPPGAVADLPLRTLRGCALGYRAPLVRDLARLVACGRVDLQALCGLPYRDARRMLLTLPGVGEKVADCVLLFACGKGEAFPVDIWVRRAVTRWYLGGRRLPDTAIRQWAQDRFGALAGYAQQHLYYYTRERGNGGTRERENAATREGERPSLSPLGHPENRKRSSATPPPVRHLPGQAPTGGVRRRPR
jgi:N-glycosylase/DNA lyase